METNDYKFQKLTPVHDAELNIYKESLDFVFKPRYQECCRVWCL